MTNNIIGKKQIKYTKVKSSDCDSGINELKIDEDFRESRDILFERGEDIQFNAPPKRTDSAKTFIWTVLLLLCYFVLSIGLTFYQQWLLKGYKFPISVVIYHLIVKFALSALMRQCYRIWTGKERVRISCHKVLTKIAPTSFFGAIDIGFSQWGLEFVHVSLYTMTKSSVIIFITFFAILFKLEKKSFSLLIIVIMISAGLFLFTYKSTEFHVLGFILLIIASISSGARWTLAQLLMQRSKLQLHNPIDMIYYMQPYMLISLIPFAWLFERERLLQLMPGQNVDYDMNQIITVWAKISVGAFLAFFLETSEFLVLRLTSSLTLSIAGIFKELIQLTIAVNTTNEVLSGYNDIGLILCLGGICLHVVHKYFIDDRDDSSDTETANRNENPNFQMTSSISPSKLANKSNSSRRNHRNIHKTPLLLTDSSSEVSNSDSERESNEIIFDIVTRREDRRAVKN